MVTNDGLMRVFWPSDLPRSKTSGILLGWRNSEHDIVVVTLLQDVELRNVENALQVGALFRSSPHPISHIFDRCGGNPPRVLGAVNPLQPPIVFNPSQIVVYTSPKSYFPQLYCPQDSNMTVQIILFDRPNPTKMQYMSPKPISLALKDKSERMVANDGSPDMISEEELRERKRKAMLAEKLKLHTTVVHRPTPKELSLPTIVDQINCSHELAALMQKNIGLVGVRSKRALSVSERVVESANNLWEYLWFWIWQALTVWVYPAMTRLFVLGLIAHRIAGELILRVLDWRLHPQQAALKDISATAQQVDIRLQQFCYWPIQYLTLRKRKADWESTTDSNPEYIRFYNSLWLVANDVIIGIALGSYVIENANFVAAQLDHILREWSIKGLGNMIEWLTSSDPAGLKLNRKLAEFLGDLFTWVINYWAGYMDNLRPFLSGIIHFIGFSAFAGATMPLSLFSDLITLLTLHIYSFYVASARIYNWQLTIIISLFHLFRGKKRNMLRNRIDSCDYDLDQLLLGTILITLLFFLLPTVLVFYLLFATARMTIIMIKAVLDTQLAFLNHFPLFALMLRIKDSRRLPGGICFDIGPSPKMNLSRDPHGPAPTSHIFLNSIPLPLSLMFDEYFALGRRIRSHYTAPGVFLCLATGRFVPPMHRRTLYSLQYSMLPSTRVSVSELWEKLSMALVEVKEGWGKERGVRRAGLAIGWGGTWGRNFHSAGMNGHVRERSWASGRRRPRATAGG